MPDGTEEWLFAAVDYIVTRWNGKTFSDAMAIVGLSREGDDFVSEPTISVTATCPCSSTNDITWLGDSEVRCDHVFAIAGCVFPEYWPTVDMSDLPHIAPHSRPAGGRQGRPPGQRCLQQPAFERHRQAAGAQPQAPGLPRQATEEKLELR